MEATAPLLTPEDTRDAALMAAYLEGDVSALDQLAALYMPQVARFTWSLMQDTELSGDAVQETFLRVIQSAERFHLTRSFRPWLFTLARRACQDIARRRARVLNKHQHFAENMGANEGILAVSQRMGESDGEARIVAIDPADDVRECLSRRERHAIAMEVLAEMDEHVRQVILLRVFEDMGFAEIAEVLDRPLSTITSIYYRNMERLKARLEAIDANGHTNSATRKASIAR